MQPSLGYTPAGANRIDFREICRIKPFLLLLLSRNFSETLTEKGWEEATQVQWTKQNRPLALRGHVTYASFKQWVGILVMPKIDRARKNNLTPEIWEETHLREIFYGTLIFQQSSLIYIGRHVGGQEYALQHGGQYKSIYFVEKSKCHIISPLNAFPLKFWV